MLCIVYGTCRYYDSYELFQDLPQTSLQVLGCRYVDDVFTGCALAGDTGDDCHLETLGKAVASFWGFGCWHSGQSQINNHI